MPSPDDIRAMDGTALTRLAFDLGLHGLHGSSFTYEEVAVHTRSPWAPHVNLAQADAVFRQLRARGWMTSILWDAADPRFSTVSAWTAQECFTERFTTTAEEALALLRCAVLAVASEPAGAWRSTLLPP